MINPNDLEPAALKKALSLLNGHDRFEVELLLALQKSGFDPESTKLVVSYLVERRFVDDRRTIINEIERRSGRRAMGRNKLREHLLTRGAPANLVDELLEGDSDDETEQAIEILRSKYKATDDRRRGARLLYSKGYDESVIEQALERFFGSVDEYGE